MLSMLAMMSTDINECDPVRPTHNCSVTSTVCVDTDGWFKCDCRVFFERSIHYISICLNSSIVKRMYFILDQNDSDYACSPINFCVKDRGDQQCSTADAQCENRANGFKCMCNDKSKTFNEDLGICESINY